MTNIWPHMLRALPPTVAHHIHGDGDAFDDGDGDAYDDTDDEAAADDEIMMKS